jgi:hypothetical protein
MTDIIMNLLMLFIRAFISTPLILLFCNHAVAFGPGYDKFPPSIQSVKGDCKGRIAITPFNEKEVTALIYNCKDRKFEAVKHSGGDLTLLPDGYYIGKSLQSDVLLEGNYTMYRGDGSEKFSISRQYLDLHDIIFEDDSVTYIKYIPDTKKSSCFGEVTPVHVEIIQEDYAGKILWRWSSGDAITKNHVSFKNGSQFMGVEIPWKTVLRPIRNCYTSVLLNIVDFKIPAMYIPFGGGFPLLEIERSDYIHPNSLQRLPTGDILVSARHLDAVFIIDKKTGRIKWSLGGKYSKFATLKPVGDPLEGFSHQHSATLIDHNLWLFDNGNRFERSSRIVSYNLDSKMKFAAYKFSFSEPNGKKRSAFGNVQVISNNEVIVGWGGVRPEDSSTPQRGVSIIDTSSNRETFFMDFAPGYATYRAKWAL